MHAKDALEDAITEIESAANFLRGACFDHRLHPEIAQALSYRAERLEQASEKLFPALNSEE